MVDERRIPYWAIASPMSAPTSAGHAVRVPPNAWRGYEAGPEGLEILVIGAPNLGEDPRGDVDGRRDWWAD